MLRALLLTIVLETALAALLGVRKKWDVATTVLSQIATNPIVVITTLLVGMRASTPVYYTVLAAMEIAAVVTEGFIYRSALDYKKINPFLLSLILNAASFGLGQVFNYFVYTR